MDLYGLSEARSQGHANTQDVDLYNEQIKVARDNINNAMDREKIQAQGNLRDQSGRDLQDKLIYDFHDAIAGGNVVSSLNKYYTQLKGATDTAKDTYSKVKQAYSSATAVGDKVSEATTNEVSRVRESAFPKSLGGGVTGTAPPLSETYQSSFLDESARVMGADGRPAPTLDERDRAETLRVQSDPNRPNAPISSEPTTGEINNRPKTNEPTSANENTPEVSETKLSSTDELSEKILNTGEQAKQAVSKVGTGLRVAGDIGGLVSTYELFKGGLAKNKDGSYDVAGDVSQIATSVGTGLDILGAIIPGAGAGFEALGAVAQGVGSIASTIDTHNKDEQATTEAQQEVDNVETQRKAQLDALPQMKSTGAPVDTMASSGLVGSMAQHLNTASSGGTF